MAGLAPVAAVIPAGSAAPCSATARSPGSTATNTAPNTAVPNDPPMDRKNVAPEVPAPRSR